MLPSLPPSSRNGHRSTSCHVYLQLALACKHDAGALDGIAHTVHQHAADLVVHKHTHSAHSSAPGCAAGTYLLHPQPGPAVACSCLVKGAHPRVCTASACTAQHQQAPYQSHTESSQVANPNRPSTAQTAAAPQMRPSSASCTSPSKALCGQGQKRTSAPR